MNRDDIIRIAQEAGWQNSAILQADLRGLERFAQLVAHAERERCAKFVEDEYVRQFDEPWRQNLARSIRTKQQA